MDTVPVLGESVGHSRMIAGLSVAVRKRPAGGSD